jgi:hypothetical protein
MKSAIMLALASEVFLFPLLQDKPIAVNQDPFTVL